MKIHFLLLALLLASLAGLAGCGDKTTDKSVPVVTRQEASGLQMIPRHLLLQPPLQYQGRISPDGQKVSWLSMVDGGLNLFVANSADPASARQETSGAQGVDVHYWTPNSAHVLFSRWDKSNDRILTWSLNVASNEVHRLGPDVADTSVRLQMISGNWPNSVLVTIQGPTQQQGDLYRINLITGDAKLVRHNPGYVKWVADEDLQPRLGVHNLPDGGQGWDLLLPNGKARRFLTLTAQQARGTRPLQLDSSGTVLYMLDSRDNDLARLVAVDLFSGETSVLAQEHGQSITHVLFHPVTGLPVAYSWEDSFTHWKALDDSFAPVLALAQENLGVHFVVLASTSDMRKLVVYSDSIDRPGKYSIIDLDNNSVTTMFETAPKQMVPQASTSIAVNIPARDGFVLSGYYTPPLTEPAANNDKAGAPLVILAPEMPGRRFHYHYDPIVAGYASRSYGVLQLNTRGSGVHHRFAAASGLQLAPRDLIDAAKWAQAQGLVGEQQGIALVSTAFGADAALKAAQAYPGIACAAVLDPLLDVPAGIARLQKNRKVQAREALAGLSPDGKAPSYRALQKLSVSGEPVLSQPVLLVETGTGIAPAPGIAGKWVTQQLAQGAQITFATIHAPADDQDNDARLAPVLAMADEFLGHCLGGEWEAAGQDLDKMDVHLVSGGDYLPGIKSALAAKTEAQSNAQ